jgi:hypothetical protein
MYKEILPDHIAKIEKLLSNTKTQLDNYRKKENSLQSVILMKENEIFTLQNFLICLQNSLIEFENERVEYGNKKYLKGLKEIDNEREMTLTKNLYHAGAFINEYLQALKQSHDRNKKTA